MNIWICQPRGVMGGVSSCSLGLMRDKGKTVGRNHSMDPFLVAIANSWKSFRETDSAVHRASYAGDVEKLRSLLGEDEDYEVVAEIVNERNPLGCTPIRLAAAAGHLDCVRLLVRHGADVNLPDVKAQPPLMMAVKNHHIECVRELLNNGANPDGDERSLCSPLYIAAMDGFTDALLELLGHGADPDVSQLRLGSHDSTPAYIALVYDRLDCFRALLAAGADPNGTAWGRIRGPTPGGASLCHAAVKHNVRTTYIEILVVSGASLHRRDERGRLACDVVDSDNDCSRLVRQLMVNPLSLRAVCRLAIRAYLGRRRLHSIDELALPQKLHSYLTFADLY